MTGVQTCALPISVQYSAADMDLAGLKREFGAELSFWGGGMDTQHALLGPGVTPQSIATDVRRNIQHEIPPETTLQM